MRKPDLVFFDPLYYTKKEKAYREIAAETPPISSYPKGKYEEFLELSVLLDTIWLGLMAEKT